MGLRFDIVSAQRKSMGARASMEFGPDGGTIGRSLDTDWSLPDGKRFLSSCHACIDFHSGSYYIIDTSTNGVFINDAEDPVGKGKPQRLFPGDRVRIGEYEMTVAIDNGEGDDVIVPTADHVDPVEASQRVAAPEPISHNLLEEHEITGVGIEILLEEDESATLGPNKALQAADALSLEEEPTSAMRVSVADADEGGTRAEAEAFELFELELEPQPTAPPAPDAAAAASPQREPPRATRPGSAGTNSGKATGTKGESGAAPTGRRTQTATKQKSKPARGSATTSRPPAATSDLVAAFCEGAGLEPIAMAPDDARETFYRLGQAMHAMVTGLTSSLRLRAVQKARLRQSQTTIQPALNNPIKFAASPQEALVRLLSPDSDAYLGPIAAVEDAFTDVNTHQRVLLAVLPKVISRFIGQLDPDELERRFAGGKRGRLMGAAQKLKYWDLYRDLYAVLAHQASDELPQSFLDALSEAYDREAKRIPAGASPEYVGEAQRTSASGAA